MTRALLMYVLIFERILSDISVIKSPPARGHGYIAKYIAKNGEVVNLPKNGRV